MKNIPETLSAPFTALLFIVLLGLAYLPALNAPPYLDDSRIFSENAESYFQHPNLSIRQAFLWWPGRSLTLLSFSFIELLAPHSLFAHHLFNLVLHILTSFLVFLFLQKLLLISCMQKKNEEESTSFLPLFGSLLFALHPLQSQAVIYIWQRSELLASLFILFTLFSFLRYLLSEENRKRQQWYILALFSALCAGISKETAAAIPLALALLLFYVNTIPKEKKKLKTQAGLFSLLPFLLPPLFYTGILFTSGLGTLAHDAHNVSSSTHPTPWSYLLSQANALPVYLSLFLFPAHQALEYALPAPHFDIPTLIRGGGIVSLFIAALLLLRKGSFRLEAFGLLLWFLLLSPTSSVIPIQDPLWEHRTYLPNLGLCIIVTGLFRRLPYKSIFSLSLFLLTAAFLLTFQRAELWSDKETFLTRNIQLYPSAGRLYDARGEFYRNIHQPEKALKDYKKAEELFPKMAIYPYITGDIYLEEKNVKKAEKAYTRALKKEPRFYEAAINRGVSRMVQGKLHEAIRDFQYSLKLRPDDPLAKRNIARCLQLMQQQRKEK